MSLYRISLTLTLVLAIAALTACSSAPQGPQPGTPAFFWQGAKETFVAKDFNKTLDNLDRAAKSDEFASKARPWSTIITAGLLRGYSELADEFELGAKSNPKNPGAFRKQVSDYRRVGRQLGMQFADQLEALKKATADPVVLDFPFPPGTASESALQDKITKGIMPQESELEGVLKQALSRGIVLAAADAAGSADQTGKAQEMFKAGPVGTPRATFMQAMGRSAMVAADLFGPRKLDEPDRAKLYAEFAKDALKGAPDSKELKAINEKIDKYIKAVKK